MVTAPLKFKKNNLIILMSKWISWDFDDTLYDPYSGQLIGQTYKIFKNQLKSSGLNILKELLS